MNTTKTVVYTDKEITDDLLETAWTIICNVSEGDWTKQTKEWQEAAVRLRTNYHALRSGK